MSNIKNGGLDQYGTGPFEQQQFGTAGVEGVNLPHSPILLPPPTVKQRVVRIPGDRPKKWTDGYGGKDFETVVSRKSLLRAV